MRVHVIDRHYSGRKQIVTGGRQRSIDSARLSFIASNPREGAIIRQCRRCFIAHNGLARLRELLRWCYPEFDRFEHWRRWSVYRALKRLGAKRIGWGLYAIS